MTGRSARVLLVLTESIIIIAMLAIQVSAAPPGTVTTVSTDMSGSQSNGISSNPEISANGNFVVFESSATNLVKEKGNGARQIFRRNLASGSIDLVSKSIAGNAANKDCIDPCVNADGRYIAFSTKATNLVGGLAMDPAATESHVCRVDMQTGAVFVVSSKYSCSESEPPIGTSDLTHGEEPSITADGRYIAYTTTSRPTLYDWNNTRDVVRKDCKGGSIWAASCPGEDFPPLNWAFTANGESCLPCISANGSLIAFQSRATNLVANDNNCDPKAKALIPSSGWDVFRKDMNTGEVVCASIIRKPATIVSPEVYTTGNRDSRYPSMSADGRYIFFSSAAFDLVGTLGDQEVNYYTSGGTQLGFELFRRDTIANTTIRCVVGNGGTAPNDDIHYSSCSSDGQKVSFSTRATNIVNGDQNGKMHVYMKNLSTSFCYRVSRAANGTMGNKDSGHTCSLDPSGKAIVFSSDASNLVKNDTNGLPDVFHKIL